jgi:hypothetical protein
MILQNKQLASLKKGVQSHKDLACTISPYLAQDVIENGWDGPVLAEPRLTLAVCFRSVPHYTSPRKKHGRNTFPTLKFPNNEHEVNDKIDDNAHTFTRRSRSRSLSPSMIYPRIDMLKLNCMIIRPIFTRTTRTTTLSSRRFSSTPEPESSAPRSPVDGYKLSSGDSIPSVGLGTWRASEEDVGKAVKVVVPKGLPDQGEP